MQHLERRTAGADTNPIGAPLKGYDDKAGVVPVGLLEELRPGPGTLQMHGPNRGTADRGVCRAPTSSGGARIRSVDSQHDGSEGRFGHGSNNRERPVDVMGQILPDTPDMKQSCAAGDADHDEISVGLSCRANQPFAGVFVEDEEVTLHGRSRLSKCVAEMSFDPNSVCRHHPIAFGLGQTVNRLAQRRSHDQSCPRVGAERLSGESLRPPKRLEAGRAAIGRLRIHPDEDAEGAGRYRVSGGNRRVPDDITLVFSSMSVQSSQHSRKPIRSRRGR